MGDPRRNIEAECLLAFEAVLAELGVSVAGRGYGANNRFDPGFGLVGQQRFQFGDLRADLPDRTIVVEVESGGGLTNLVKYWPLAAAVEKPILLLHAFGQGSLNDYVSHLRLWDHTWNKMKAELWVIDNTRLFACRFQYTHAADDRLRTAATALRNCLTLPLDDALRKVFAYEPQTARR